MYVTLEEAKSYLKVYYTEADDEIARLITAAEKHVENFLGRPLSELAVNADNSPPDLDVELPEHVKLGILMHVNDFWNNREITITGSIVAESPMAERILHFERKGLGV